MKKIIENKMLLSVILSVLLFVVLIPTLLRPIFMVSKRNDLLLQLAPKGGHSENSWGNEIRIAEIKVNGKLINLQDLIQNKSGWEMNGNILFTSGTEALPIKQSMKSVEMLQIKFIGQRGSGIIELEEENEKLDIDLYRDSDWEEITWDLPRSIEFKPWMRIDLIIEMIMITGGFIFCCLKISDGKREGNL